jgi:NADPH:quinone reductase-like Zn-dependent oxidoreductase
VRVVDIPKPIPGDKEILLKVHASTVNRTDCGFRSAEYFISRFFSGLLKPKLPVLGCEFAGEVEAIGKLVNRFKPGDKLFGFNDAHFGGHAEYILLKDTDALALIPEGINYEEAAALTEGGHYALCDIYAMQAKPDQHILVNGATGAIGSAAVQLLKYFGVHVTAVCSTAHVEKVRALGADVVIDHRKEDFTKLPVQFDAVFDAVGKSSFGKCKPILKNKGLYVSTELGKIPGGPLQASCLEENAFCSPFLSPNRKTLIF